MTALIIFILIVIGLNLIPYFTKWDFPEVEKAINRVLIITTATFIVLTTLVFCGYKLKGVYLNPIIGVIFITTTILYFVLVKSTKRKLLEVVILMPLILISLITLSFSRTIYESKIADGYKIKVSTGGLFSCGELIKLTEAEFFLFDKAIVQEKSLCLRDIERIETIKFDRNSAEFLIYHNGEMDSENPYKYKIENNNMW